MEGSMTTPRTVAGQAALSGVRPYVKRALARTIVAIETEAAAPYLEALREADRVLEELLATSAALDLPSRVDLVQHAATAHQLVSQLLAQPTSEDQA
jgi:hypothetical protein